MPVEYSHLHSNGFKEDLFRSFIFFRHEQTVAFVHESFRVVAVVPDGHICVRVSALEFAYAQNIRSKEKECRKVFLRNIEESRQGCTRRASRVYRVTGHRPNAKNVVLSKTLPSEDFQPSDAPNDNFARHPFNTPTLKEVDESKVGGRHCFEMLIFFLESLQVLNRLRSHFSLSR